MAEKEYIEREKLIRKVQYIRKTYNISNVITEKLKKAIDNSVVTVTDVVLCKDCEHAEPLRDDGDKLIYKSGTVICGRCLAAEDKRAPDWYCPMGERRKQK